MFYSKDYPFTEEEVETIIDNFKFLYQKYRGKEHPPIPKTTLQRIIEKLPTDGLTYFEFDDYFPMMMRYFQTDFKGYQCDYKMAHFMSGTIRTNRLREVQKERQKQADERE